MRYGSESYRYQKLVRDFLMSELEAEAAIDKKALYRVASGWNREHGNILAAIDMASKCGDIPLLENIARLHSYAYGRFNIGVESYVRKYMPMFYASYPPKLLGSPRVFAWKAGLPHMLWVFTENR